MKMSLKRVLDKSYYLSESMVKERIVKGVEKYITPYNKI